MTGHQGCGSPITILAACFKTLAASNNSNIRCHCRESAALLES